MGSPHETLLIVEDDPGLSKQLTWCFQGTHVISVADRAAAVAEVRRHEPAVVLQDLGLPPDPSGASEGLACLADILRAAPNTKVIVITGNAERADAVRAITLGAYDYYEKPIEQALLQTIVRRAFKLHELESENRRLQSVAAEAPLKGIVTASGSMASVCRIVEKVAPTAASVLLLGESGVGKEVLARTIHDLSPRAARPFVAINCAAIPESLLESELFGFERGAFTGAHKLTLGKIEAANGGSLLLDEIGDMPATLQSKLLRFLQERSIERIGGRISIAVDVRIVCATNQDLQSLIAAGRFRQDLYYRISEVAIQIPALRDRDSDGVLIAQYLLRDRVKRHGKKIRGFSTEAVSAIRAHPWPGNIRELENKVNAAVILADGPLITDKDLGLPAPAQEMPFLNLRAARHEAELHCVRQALALSDGNLSRAAELMGITRPTLYELLERFGMKRPA